MLYAVRGAWLSWEALLGSPRVLTAYVHIANTRALQNLPVLSGATRLSLPSLHSWETVICAAPKLQQVTILCDDPLYTNFKDNLNGFLGKALSHNKNKIRRITLIWAWKLEISSILEEEFLLDKRVVVRSLDPYQRFDEGLYGCPLWRQWGSLTCLECRL